MRQVYIRHEPAKHSFFVLYFSRNKYQRHSAAQFDDRNHTLETVTRYVRQRDDLQLVCAIGGQAI